MALRPQRLSGSSPTRPSGREGKWRSSRRSRRRNSRAQGDMMVPPTPASAFEVIEPQLAFHVFVNALGPPTLLEDAHHLLGAQLPGDRNQREVGGFGPRPRAIR